MTWLKESGGPIRTSDNPNVRVQDGPKMPLLCSGCEQLFSAWEKSFCEDVFIPAHKGHPQRIDYGPWALKFAASVSWRVLFYFSQSHDLDHLNEQQKALAPEALRTWETYLLGTSSNPGPYEQHVVVTGLVDSYSGPKISPFLNRYLTRNVHISVPCTNTSAFAYTKMGRIVLFGTVQGDMRRWKGTKLHVNHGHIFPNRYSIPATIGHYWNEMADESGEALKSMSKQQKTVVQRRILSDIEKFKQSEVARAIRMDYLHSGRAAFDYD